MEKILTVSIAAYNVEKFLDDTLKSLVVPDIMDYLEVLIINDGSSDATTQIAQSYCDEYPNTFRLINKENGGWGSTVNVGIDNAKGKYFKLLDGDDYFCNLDKLISVLRTVEADLIYTPYDIFYDDSDDTENVPLSGSLPKNKVVDIDPQFFNSKFAMHSCVFMTSKIRDKFRITEKCFYTDIEYIFSSIVNVKTVYFCDISVYQYRLGRQGQSASNAGYIKHYKEHRIVLDKLLNRYKELETDSVYKTIYASRLYEMVELQRYIYLLLEANNINWEIIEEFERMIKTEFPEFWPTRRKRVQFMRLLGKISYRYVVYK